MLKYGLSFMAIIALFGCSSNSVYRGIGKEAKNFATPAPIPSQYFPNKPMFPTWTDGDEEYRFFPGDEIEINVLSANELNKSAIVAPDGRISPNLIGPIMVADKTPSEVKAMVEQRYAKELKNPSVTISPKTFASQKIYVGGEVNKPGVYELNGELDPLHAVMLAGGFLNSAKREEIVVLRRGAGGQPFMRVFDLKNIFAHQEAFAELPRLRRLDVIWVPRSRISEAGLFTQQFVRDALPITIGFNYSINGGKTF